MRPFFRLFAIAIPLLALAGPATSQMPTGMPVRPGREPLPPGFITVSLNLNLSMPFDANSELEAQVEAAQRRAYVLAGKQCDVILSTIATDCSIAGLSSNVHMQSPAQMQRLTVGVQVSLSVKLKSGI